MCRSAAQAVPPPDRRRSNFSVSDRHPPAPIPGSLADISVHFEVSQLYFAEAEWLDAGRFTDWLSLFTDDLAYWMPTRTNRLRRQQALSIAAPNEAAFYDETKQSLAWRIRRFDSGMAWAEDPPSRTRHLVSNVVVRHADPADGYGPHDFVATSAFLVYRNRLDREVGVFAGGRTDLLRREPDTNELRVARRTILLDQSTLLSKNISTFF
jgi:3-phenylpropionate/cinnamic acid dioxygenase small subunit